MANKRGKAKDDYPSIDAERVVSKIGIFRFTLICDDTAISSHPAQSPQGTQKANEATNDLEE